MTFRPFRHVGNSDFRMPKIRQIFHDPVRRRNSAKWPFGLKIGHFGLNPGAKRGSVPKVHILCIKYAFWPNGTQIWPKSCINLCANLENLCAKQPKLTFLIVQNGHFAQKDRPAFCRAACATKMAIFGPNDQFWAKSACCRLVLYVHPKVQKFALLPLRASKNFEMKFLIKTLKKKKQSHTPSPKETRQFRTYTVRKDRFVV